MKISSVVPAVAMTVLLFDCKVLSSSRSLLTPRSSLLRNAPSPSPPTFKYDGSVDDEDYEWKVNPTPGSRYDGSMDDEHDGSMDDEYDGSVDDEDYEWKVNPTPGSRYDGSVDDEDYEWKVNPTPGSRYDGSMDDEHDGSMDDEYDGSVDDEDYEWKVNPTPGSRYDESMDDEYDENVDNEYDDDREGLLKNRDGEHYLSMGDEIGNLDHLFKNRDDRRNMWKDREVNIFTSMMQPVCIHLFFEHLSRSDGVCAQYIFNVQKIPEATLRKDFLSSKHNKACVLIDAEMREASSKCSFWEVLSHLRLS